MISAERTSEIFKCMVMYYANGYDYFKYNGRLKAQPKNPSLHFKIIADKLRSQDMVENFFSANISNLYTLERSIQKNIFSYSKKDCFDLMDKTNYYQKNFDKNFSEYVKTKTRFKELISPEYNQPLIVIDTLQRKIPLDILSYMLYFYKTLKDKLNTKNDPLVEEVIKIATRHGIFLAKKEKISSNLSELIMNLDK